jgi:hypothetical protein
MVALRSGGCKIVADAEKLHMGDGLMKIIKSNIKLQSDTVVARGDAGQCEIGQ